MLLMISRAGIWILHSLTTVTIPTKSRNDAAEGSASMGRVYSYATSVKLSTQLLIVIEYENASPALGHGLGMERGE